MNTPLCDQTGLKDIHTFAYRNGNNIGSDHNRSNIKGSNYYQSDTLFKCSTSNIKWQEMHDSLQTNTTTKLFNTDVLVSNISPLLD